MAESADNPVVELRERLREDIAEKRNQKRYAELCKKRPHFADAEKELKDISLMEVEEFAKQIRKSRIHEAETLRKLNKAFLQGEAYISAFLQVGGALQGMIGLLTCNDSESQLEAVGCLINLLTADHRTTKTVAKASSAYFVTFLSSSSSQLQELSAWALGNFAADCGKCASILRDQEFVPLILPLIKSAKVGVVHSAVYAISCYLKNLPSESSSILIKGLGSEVANLLVSLRRSEAFIDFLLLIFRLSTSEASEEYLTAPRCIREYFAVLNDELEVNTQKETTVITLVIRIMGNICSGSIGAKNIICFPGAGKFFLRLVTCQTRHVVKETLWLLANLSSYDEPIVKDFFTVNSELVSVAYEKLSLGDCDTTEQALVFLCNARSLLAPEENVELLKLNLRKLFPLLDSRSELIIQLSLHLAVLTVQRVSDLRFVSEELDHLNRVCVTLRESSTRIAQASDELLRLYNLHEHRQ